MRAPNMLEYLQSAIKRGLQDGSAYVRKTAVMGLLKLHRVSPEAVGPSSFQSSFLEQLYSRCLLDKDPMVVLNTIFVLNEIEVPNGGLQLSKKVVCNLLSRVSTFTEWGQCAVLALVASYSPANESELFDMLNLLDGRLKHASAGVVLAAAKCFLDLTAPYPTLYSQALQRLRTPLLTLISTSPPEVAFVVLAHVKLLVTGTGGEGEEATALDLENDYRDFFCRHSDPTYVKELKTDILTRIATESNVSQIRAELAEYISDVDANLCRRSLLALGGIAARVPSAASDIAEQLLALLALESPHITNTALLVVVDVASVCPIQNIEGLAAVVEPSLAVVSGDDSMAAILWIIGEIGEHIPSAPYLLEGLVASIPTKDTAARLQLLTSGLRLFFKRAPEMQPVLAAILKAGLSEALLPDVRDRALLYYRMLEVDVNATREAMMTQTRPPLLPVNSPTQEESAELLREFDSLSVIYCKPAALFVKALEEDQMTTAAAGGTEQPPS
eukprot:GHVU01224164.1.p1 GENE.GHVU01224164.1~~GHVU01224164.1.p1  ORF type:complete len:530 (-),score=133.52 GHVU01224164.1:365-1867(-)